MEDDKGAEISSAAARPDESRRDPERTRVDLEAWLTTKLGASAEPAVSRVTVPESNGMSSETVLVDASWVAEGERVEHPLVFRIAPDPSAVPVFQTYDFDAQFRVMAKVRELSDVPVPEVYWLEEDPAAHRCAVLRDESDQRRGAARRACPTTSATTGSSTRRSRTSSASRSHRSTRSPVCTGSRIRRRTSTSSRLDAEGDTPLRRHVADLRGYYEWVSSDGDRSPLIERCFDWLDEHWPTDEGEAVLSWGDARIGNTMYRRLRARRRARLGDGRPGAA